MKRFKALFMFAIMLFAITWTQATIPDTKENLKTAIVTPAKVVKMEKQNLNFSISKQTEFVINNYVSEVPIFMETTVLPYLPTKAVRNFSKTIKSKKKNLYHRSPRDGYWRKS